MMIDKGAYVRQVQTVSLSVAHTLKLAITLSVSLHHIYQCHVHTNSGSFQEMFNDGMIDYGLTAF